MGRLIALPVMLALLNRPEVARSMLFGICIAILELLWAKLNRFLCIMLLIAALDDTEVFGLVTSGISEEFTNW